MGGRVSYDLMFFFLLGFFLSSGSTWSTDPKRSAEGDGKQLTEYISKPVRTAVHTNSISTSERDINTPITTVPTIIPATTTTSTPIINPNSDPDSTSPATPMVITPATGTGTTASVPVSPGSSWCIASQSASPRALQVALDYACGYGGADSSAIQPSGSCYNPNTVRDHASYAFNSYYQKNPTPSSCNFGGTALTTSTDPSNGTCQFPSTSTSSSVLNASNSNGATVYGAVPSSPTPSSAAPKYNNPPHITSAISLLVLLDLISRQDGAASLIS